jgi:predicted DsbA family dithiol-disulfide isomerase
MTITIDVISDVICPWCFVGKRRLEKAVQALGGQHEVRVQWHPFQLNPKMPLAGMARREYRVTKFGSWERSLALDAQMKEVGAGEGIAFNFDAMGRTPNTLDAHRLIWLAGEQGVQNAVVEALFLAYFCEGRDLSNRQTLLDVVAGAGLARSRAEAVLNSDEGLEAIRAAEEQSRQLRVQGVPFFVLNDSLALSGAQKPEVILDAFNQLTVSAP